MSTAQELEQYLQSLAQHTGTDSVPGHILKHGRRFASTALDDLEQAYCAQIDWRSCRIKQCWWNSQTVALTLPEMPGMTLRYVEGYVVPGISVAVEHAWLSLNGKVIDPTLRITEQPYRRIRGLFPDDWAFWGVEMEPQMCEHALEHSESTPLIDDHRCGWPLIPRRHSNVSRRALHQESTT